MTIVLGLVALALFPIVNLFFIHVISTPPESLPAHNLRITLYIEHVIPLYPVNFHIFFSSIFNKPTQHSSLLMYITTSWRTLHAVTFIFHSESGNQLAQLSDMSTDSHQTLPFIYKSRFTVTAVFHASFIQQNQGLCSSNRCIRLESQFVLQLSDCLKSGFSP